MLGIMREEALLYWLKCQWTPITGARHAQRRYPNLLKEQTVRVLNQAWMVDIIYNNL